MKKSLYNFTNNSVSQTLLDQIENGIKSVPNMKKSGRRVVKGVLGEILQNLKMFRRRQQRRPPINHWRVKNWLDIAIRDIDEDTEDEHIAYYKHIRENLDKAVRIIKWNSDESQCELRAKDIKLSAEIPGAVFVLADKNYGMSLIPVETMIQAETNMLKELDAKMINSDSKEIISTVEERIRKFEKSLYLGARQHLDSMDFDRFARPSEIKVPFLKLNAKLHKMKSVDINDKNLSRLKFRPVQDSSAWIMKPYAVLLMTLLRDLMNALKMKYNSISKIASEDGSQISKDMRLLKLSDEKTKLFISSDMSSAYTNIFKDDVFKAVITATELLKVNDWRRDLILKLIELVLGNNYIESSTGIFQLGDCLPMGSSASQDCLNIVGMISELQLFENATTSDEIKVIVGDNFEVNIVIQKNTKHKDSLTRSEKGQLKLYKRYIDDTHSVCSGENLTDMKNIIIKVLQAYPKNLVMNATLSLLSFSHLDCLGFCGFSQNKITTIVRKNFTAPINIVPSQSNCPASNKYCIILSEMLRYRRICSSSQFIEMNEHFLFKEMLKAGYNYGELKIKFMKSREYIKENYNEGTFVKINENSKEFEETFCGKVTFDKNSGSHKIVKALMMGDGKTKLKPILVPSSKIKTYLISRRKHLKKLRDFVTYQS